MKLPFLAKNISKKPISTIYFNNFNFTNFYLIKKKKAFQIKIIFNKKYNSYFFFGNYNFLLENYFYTKIYYLTPPSGTPRDFFFNFNSNFFLISREIRRQGFSQIFKLNYYYKLNLEGKRYRGGFVNKMNPKKAFIEEYHINNILLQLYLNRDYSLGNFFNTEVKFGIYYTPWMSRLSEYSFNKNFNNVDNLFEMRKCISIFNQKLLLLFISSKIIYKKIILLLIKSNNNFWLNMDIHFLISKFNIRINYKKLNFTKTFLIPQEYFRRGPFEYRAYKFGRKSQRNLNKILTEKGLTSYKIKKGHENLLKNSTSKIYHDLNEKLSHLINYESWYVSVTNSYNYYGFNRTNQLGFLNKKTLVFSRKDFFKKYFLLERSNFFPFVNYYNNWNLKFDSKILLESNFKGKLAENLKSFFYKRITQANLLKNYEKKKYFKKKLRYF